MIYLYAFQKSISKNELKRVDSCGKRSNIAQMRDSGTEEETGSRCWSWQAGGQGEEKRDLVKEDMRLVGLREEDAQDGVRWRHTIGCGHT